MSSWHAVFSAVILPFMLVAIMVVFMMVGAAWIAVLITPSPYGRAVIFVLLLLAAAWGYGPVEVCWRLERALVSKAKLLISRVQTWRKERRDMKEIGREYRLFFCQAGSAAFFQGSPPRIKKPRAKAPIPSAVFGAAVSAVCCLSLFVLMVILDIFDRCWRITTGQPKSRKTNRETERRPSGAD